jgi:hypothetical protein
MVLRDLTHGEGGECVPAPPARTICVLTRWLVLTWWLVPFHSTPLSGCETYSKWSGYAQGFVFGGDHVDCSPRDADGSIATTIAAIDALSFYDKGSNPELQ